MLASIAQDEQVRALDFSLKTFFSPSGVKANFFFAHGGRLCWLETFQKKYKRLLILPPVDSIDTRRNGNCILEYTR